MTTKPHIKDAKLVKPGEPTKAESEGEVTTPRDDVAQWNRYLAQQQAKWGGLRVKRGFFRCPWPCTQGQLQNVTTAARDKWIDNELKLGWDFKDQFAVSVEHRREATSYSGDWSIVLPGYVEIPMLGLFLKRKVERQRIEVPVTDE